MPYKKDLTIESAFAEMGEGGKITDQMEIDAESDFVKGYRKNIDSKIARLLLDESYASIDNLNYDNADFKSKKFREAVIYLGTKLINNEHEGINLWDKAMQSKFICEIKKYCEKYKNNDWGTAYLLLGDSIANAIEHGSNFCKKGSIWIRSCLGNKNILIVIDDPGDGFDIDNLDEILEKKSNESLIPRKSRGHFLQYDLNKPLFERKVFINHEKIPNGFRTILLFKIGEN